MVFESVKKERTAKAWSYFLLEKSTEKAQCILCKKILKATGSSTKSLNDHLKLKHANEWMKDSKIENSPQKVLKTKCQPKIDTFVKPQKKSPESHDKATNFTEIVNSNWYNSSKFCGE